jgi:hypothetical protein
MRPAQQPADSDRNRNCRIWLLLYRSLYYVGKARRCVLSLTIEVFSCARDLPRLSLELCLGVASHPADAFLDFAADVLGGPGYSIFVHDEVLRMF